MTLSQLISAVDEIQPNVYSEQLKTSWVNELASAIQIDVWLTKGEITYEWPDDRSKELLPIPSTFATMWNSWLKAKIHAANEEGDLYNNAMQMYNEAYGAYIRWFSRRYYPADRRIPVNENFDLHPGAIFTLPPDALMLNLRLVITYPFPNGTKVRFYRRSAMEPVGDEIPMDSTGEFYLGIIEGDSAGTVIGCTVDGETTAGNAKLFGTVLVPHDGRC